MQYIVLKILYNADNIFYNKKIINNIQNRHFVVRKFEKMEFL
jgi:hypothetical protein